MPSSQDTTQHERIVVALYPFKAIEGGDLSLEKVNISIYMFLCVLFFSPLDFVRVIFVNGQKCFVGMEFVDVEYSSLFMMMPTLWRFALAFQSLRQIHTIHNFSYSH